LKVGDPRDPKTFYSAVIDKSAFRRIKDYVNYSKATHRVIAGGKSDDSVGYYVYPTIVEVDNSKDKLLIEEIFGPVLSVYEFPDKMLQKDIFGLIENVPFGLTGAVFAQDE
jgi:1-pyrroline-5-carboxylate dehydrogenase